MEPLFTAVDGRLFISPSGAPPGGPGLVVVDLGFGKTTVTTGVWSDAPPTSVRLDYGDAIAAVTTAIASRPPGPVCLCLESPLSYFINANGNPEARIDAEAADKRYWYVNSGASVSLAGMFFLERLARCIGWRDGLFVLEAYSTNKPGAVCDACEAEEIGNALRSATPSLELPRAGSRPLRPDLVSGAPPIFMHQVSGAIPMRGKCKVPGH